MKSTIVTEFGAAGVGGLDVGGMAGEDGGMTGEDGGMTGEDGGLTGDGGGMMAGSAAGEISSGCFAHTWLYNVLSDLYCLVQKLHFLVFLAIVKTGGAQHRNEVERRKMCSFPLQQNCFFSSQ